jgi:transcriptional regulator with XRE-family HTH domain
VLWLDPRSAAGTFTVPIVQVQRDADLKARLAYAIRAAREEAGLTRPQLASLVGVGRGSVLAWEKGDSVPSLLNLGTLCEALGVSAELFAHPPAIPQSVVEPYRLRAEVKEAVEDYG